jgi:hypothetical protein
MRPTATITPDGSGPGVRQRRRRRWTSVAGVLVVLAAAGVVGSVVAAAGLLDDQPRVGAPPGAGAAQPGPYRRGVWLLLGSGSNHEACRFGTGRHYRYIVVQWYIARDRGCPPARIKAVNPEAQVLAYQNVGAMIRRPHSDHRPSSCVTQEEAAAHERLDAADSWYLHDTAGHTLTYPDFPFLAPANVARASYQRACEHHLQQIRADGFDGVFADDVNLYPGHGLGESTGTPIREFPRDVSYQDAMVDAVHLVGPDARLEDLLFVSNVGMKAWLPAHRDAAVAVARDSSAFFRDFWMRWAGPGPNFHGADWEAVATLQQAVEELGRPFLAMTRLGPSAQGQTADQQYAVASFWVMWNGTQESAWGYDIPEHPGSSFSSAWGPDIGTPLNPNREPVGVGWQRRYSGGIAIVNPSGTVAQRFDLGGRYRSLDGTVVSSATLPPTAGMVLSNP